MKHYPYFWALPFCIVLVANCATPKKHDDLWDSHGYVDNDQYYSSPDCSIMDSPNCGG